MEGFEIDLLPVTSGEHSGDCIAFRYGDLQAGGDKQTVVVVDGGYGKNAADLKAHLKKYYNCTTKEGKVHIKVETPQCGIITTRYNISNGKKVFHELLGCARLVNEELVSVFK
ncbi:MAG: hypothetical protein E7102_02745 [Prevotella ruminicola]|uniref:Uncharacterized protein n=1 Tax=Xylanibacter ruminicola TaxID=839 RepID=A0A928GFW3_XYLRU|nr:hypothetical protein [Xylanibacter ruminicola]